jgi:hypothetical protein
MKTAVEWLENRFLQTEGNLYAEDFTKAKEMEKEQVIDAYIAEKPDGSTREEYAEQYYNETFKSE